MKNKLGSLEFTEEVVREITSKAGFFPGGIGQNFRPYEDMTNKLNALLAERAAPLLKELEAARKALSDIRWHGPTDIQGQIVESFYRKFPNADIEKLEGK